MKVYLIINEAFHFLVISHHMMDFIFMVIIILRIYFLMIIMVIFLVLLLIILMLLMDFNINSISQILIIKFIITVIIVFIIIWNKHLKLSSHDLLKFFLYHVLEEIKQEIQEIYLNFIQLNFIFCHQIFNFSFLKPFIKLYFLFVLYFDFIFLAINVFFFQFLVIFQPILLDQSLEYHFSMFNNLLFYNYL